MGSIESYESAKGRRYRVRYRKPDHSQGAKSGFRTKRDAEAYLASVRTDLGEQPAIVDPQRGVALVSHVAPELSGVRSGDVKSLLSADIAPVLAERARTARADVFRSVDATEFAPPYRTPAKIWGIRLNYHAHAGDLAEKVPAQPGSFITASHTIIGPGDDIVLPEPDLAGRIEGGGQGGFFTPQRP